MPRQMFHSALRILITTAALLAASSAALADTKNFTVTAPDDTKLAVQESGNPEGDHIVLIHGLLGSQLSWEAQLQSPQLQRYRMITYDLRGHGLSGKPTDANAYREGSRWADELETVIESSPARNPVLVGWSLGGVVISNYLAAYGDRCRRSFVQRRDRWFRTACALLHGYPQTHLAWRFIAPRLANLFTVIAPDLPGYGKSKTHMDPPRWTKRRAANAMVTLMAQLGYQQFSVVGHDRGARVGYRLALDHPDQVTRYASLAVIPTLDAWNALDMKYALANFH